MKILEFIKDFFTIDMVVILFLGVGLFFLTPDLQAQIVAGMIGYIGRGTIETLKKVS